MGTTLLVAITPLMRYQQCCCSSDSWASTFGSDSISEGRQPSDVYVGGWFVKILFLAVIALSSTPMNFATQPSVVPCTESKQESLCHRSSPVPSRTVS
jgi:hypothetical protein